jgi:hypothetical protein
MKRIRLIIPTERCAQVADDGRKCSTYCVYHVGSLTHAAGALCAVRGYSEPIVDGNRTELCLSSETKQ